MSIPQAAPPTSPSPGLWLTVDLKPKIVSPGSQPLKILLMAPSNASGSSITDNTEIKPLYSVTDAETYGGTGSLASLGYASIQRRCPTARVDLIAPAKSGGNTASGTFTASGAITTSGTVRCTISGLAIDVPWNVGENAAAFHTKAVSYIGRYADKLYATASTTGTAVDLAANGPGPAGNDITIRCSIIEGCAGGSITASGARLTGGTTEPDFTTALAQIQGDEYDEIVLCLSNADAVSTTGNVARTLAAVNSLNTGNRAKLQQIIVGHTGARSSARSATTTANDQVLEIVTAQNADSLPCEFAGEEAGDRAFQRSKYYSKNRIDTTFPNLKGSPNPITDNPTTADSDASLLAGLSIIGYSSDGAPYLIRAVTSYNHTATNAQVLPTDCNEIDAMYEVAKDVRAYLPVEYAGCSVARDQEEGDEEMPEGVVEERDIKASIISRIDNFWIPKGVIQGPAFHTAVLNGELIVQVNDTDETQVDIFVPLKPIKNLAKLGVYVAKTG